MSAVAGRLAGAVAIAMLVVPPATLTSATVAHRAINSSGVGVEVQSVDDAEMSSDAVFASFTVLEWDSLLRQTSDTAFYGSNPVDVVGFVTADADDPDSVFYVSRFVVTCCAVDTQPVGVQESTQQIILIPAAVTPVGEPSEPYLF